MSDKKMRSGILAHHRTKLIGFIIAEALALGILLLSGALALGPSRLIAPALVMSVNIATIASAAAVAIIPIIFFAIAPVLPRGER